MIPLKKPWQAILWEELSVSGTITLALVVVEVWIVYLFHFVFPEWKFYVVELDTVTYFFPGLNALLLMLIRGNQGELRGGFQRRLLLLPTHVISMVSIILFSRLFLVLFHTFVLRSACIYFLAEPWEVTYGDWKYVYTKLEMILDSETLINLSADGCIYLLLQFLFWVFHWSKPVFGLIVAGIIFLIVRVDIDVFLFGKSNLLGAEIKWSLPIYIRGLVIDYPLEVLFLGTLVIWHLCMIVVKFYRHNILSSFSLLSSLDFGLRRKKQVPLRGFKTPYSALLWYEFKYGGFSLFRMTVFLWILIVVGNSLISSDDVMWKLLSFDIPSLLKHYISYGRQEFNFGEAPFIALFFAILYYFLRYSLRYSRAHPKYAGIIRFFPANNFERANAYLLMLSVNSLLIGLFIGLCILCHKLVVIYSNPFDTNLFLYGLKKIIFAGTSTDFWVVGVLLISFLGMVMFVGLVVFAVLASKEVLPALALYLILYGSVGGIGIYGSDYAREENNLFGELYKSLSSIIESVDKFLEPARANIFYLYLILTGYFFYLVLKNSLLKKKEILSLFVIFILTFVSVYPWNFVYGDLGKILFQVRFYALLPLIVVFSYLSCLLSLQGFSWRNGFRQVISTGERGNEFSSGFFWRSKMPLLIMLFFIFLFRLDLGYLTKYGLRKELSSIKQQIKPNFSEDAIVDGIKLVRKFDSVAKKSRKIAREWRKNKGTKIVFDYDYVYDRAQSFTDWYSFIGAEKEGIGKRIPCDVYNAMIDYYNEYGREISLLIREFAEDSKYISEEGKQYFQYFSVSSRWRDIFFLSKQLDLEKYIRAINGDLDGLINTLLLKEEFNKTTNFSILPRRWLQIYWFLTWYTEYAEMPIEKMEEILKLANGVAQESYKDDYESFNKTELLDLQFYEKLMEFPFLYWEENFLAPKDRHRMGGYEYYYPRYGFYSELKRNLFELVSNSRDVMEMYYPLFDLVTLWRALDISEKVFFYSCHKYEWEKFLEKGYIENRKLGEPGVLYLYLHKYLLLVGMSIERYRMKYGKLPDTLDQLVPEFIDVLPCDPYNKGLDLSYKKLEPLGFVVYSFGRDCIDDGGFSWSQLSISSRKFYFSRNIVSSDEIFIVPPIIFRQHGFVEGINVKTNINMTNEAYIVTTNTEGEK